MNKKWEVIETDEEKAKIISEKFNLSMFISRLLVNKGIVDEEKISVFINPTRNSFYDPFLMPDMEKAVNRIIKAIDNKEKTIIYGDYDVDGITSSVVLKSFLEERGLKTDIYIPNRLDEGYGLNEDAVEKLADDEYKLMITVDCGITGNKEVELANSLGIDVVITDHHEPLKAIPDAVAVVDAKRDDNEYPFRGLAGVGVTFKLIQAISIKMKLPAESNLKYLDIVCIGTISDIVPLQDENRVISQLGLMLIKQTKNIGLKVLLESIGYNQIDSNTVSFGLAPRINACGRMGHEKVAVDLLLTNDIKKAKDLTEKLNKYNQERQNVEKKIFEEAVQIAKKTKKRCVVVGKENWHHGVIGIVSSKITEILGKPSILLCYEDGIAKGSGRSIKGFDLHEALENCEEYIEQFGGHSMAVGVTLKQENVEKFSQRLDKYAESMNIETIVPILLIDQKVELKDITIDDIRQLRILEPFGEANSVPLFQFSNLKIDSIRALSEGKHLKLILKDENNRYLDVIGFNIGNLSEEYRIGEKVDVVGNLKINNYNNQESIQLILNDIRHTL